MSQQISKHMFEGGQPIFEIDSNRFFRSLSRLCNVLLDNGKDIPTFSIHFTVADGSKSGDCVPNSERLLLGFKEAASLLSMTEQALRDLVHKGQGPETVKRGTRVCFTHEGLEKYVQKLPREKPHHGILEVLYRNGTKTLSVEERRVFGKQ